MSAELKLSTLSVNPSLVRNLDARQESILYLTPDKLQRPEAVQYEDVYMDSPSGFDITQAKEFTFQIPASEGIVSGFKLEFGVPPANTGESYATSELPFFALIDYVQWWLGNANDKIDGRAMLQWISMVNQGTEFKKKLYALAGGSGGNIAATSYFVPLVVPGQLGDIGHGSRTQPVHLHLLGGSPYTIKVALRAGSSVGPSGVSQTALRLNRLRLWYKKWKATPEHYRGFNQQILLWPRFRYQTYVRSQTANSQDSFSMSDIATDAETYWLGVYAVSQANETSASAPKFFTTIPITNLQLQLQNQTLYSHDTLNDALAKYLTNFDDELSAVYHNSTEYPIYNIPLSLRPRDSIENIGNLGTNLNGQSPVLLMTQGNTQVNHIHVVTASKGIIEINGETKQARFITAV
jgi:hypothetical protein